MFLNIIRMFMDKSKANIVKKKTIILFRCPHTLASDIWDYNHD